MSHIDECRLVDLERIEDPRGNLSPLYGGQHVPFAIKRVFYLYDIPGGADRGAHAHRALEQLIVAVSGSFVVTLDDGQRRRSVSLDRSYYGLYVPSMIWSAVTSFCSGAVCLVFASLAYDEADYIRDYQEFVEIVGGTANVDAAG